jgi:hypothetical protein
MKGTKRLPLLIMIAALLLSSVSATRLQTASGNCRYFAETSHYVCDEFLDFYEAQKENAVVLFGFPLTEAFDDPTRQLRVQYFQRVRMEWHPNNPDPYKVQLGLLADELGYNYYPRARPEQIPAINSAVHHHFTETGHVVSYVFLQYFREMGGLDIFGYPRSEFMFENGYTVQYFQRARMVWHPESIHGPQMHLTNLGEIYLERIGLPVGYERFGQSRIGEAWVTKLDASASVRRSSARRGDTQTIFVYVSNQQGVPVEDVNVRAIIGYQSGGQPCNGESFQPTNASGFTRCSFKIPLLPPGKRVVIDVIVQYGTLTTTTQTSFLPWW